MNLFLLVCVIVVLVLLGTIGDLTEKLRNKSLELEKAKRSVAVDGPWTCCDCDCPILVGESYVFWANRGTYNHCGSEGCIVALKRGLAVSEGTK